MKYKTIVIGSSTGIGLAITKKLLDHNHKVTGVSRSGLNLDNALYNHFHIGGFPKILAKFDRLSMAYGVEVRSPFVDHRIVSFLFSMLISACVYTVESF